MEGPRELTDIGIKALAPAARRYEVVDTLAVGLRLRVQPSGLKTWSLLYRPKKGGRARLSLGAYPTVTLSVARKAAKKRLAEVCLGGDPAADLREARRRAKLDERTTVAALTADCVAALDLRPSTRAEWGRLSKAEIVPAFGKRQACEVTRADIRLWSESIRDGKRRWRPEGRPAPYTANRAFELLRRVFSWAVSRDLLDASPFPGIEKPAVEESSARVLLRDELRALVRALDSSPRTVDVFKEMWTTYADAVRLLLLTLVRRAAVLGMKRSELEGIPADPAAAAPDARWVIPGGAEGRSKSGKPHVVPLSAQALAVIRRRMVDVETEHLFPVDRARAEEDRPVDRAATWPTGFVTDLRTEVVKQYRAILEDEAVDVPRWRIHDLRHTAATHLREDLAVSGEVVSLLLGHTPAGPRVTRVYDRSTLLPERRAALVAWGAWLDRLASEKPRKAEVFPLLGRG